jgi:predicted XRE-type DNA-binding protein
MSKRAVIESSGNVYADLEQPDAEQMIVKADLVMAIAKAISARGFKSQTEVAKCLGIDQPKVSKLLRGQFRAYSVERLMGFLVRLGHDVEIKVRKQPRAKPGHIHVVAA